MQPYIIPAKQKEIPKHYDLIMTVSFSDFGKISIFDFFHVFLHVRFNS